MVLFADGPMTTAFLAALAVTAGILLLKVRRRPASPESLAARNLRPHGAEPLRGPAAPGEYTRWEVQMHETARDLVGRLDTKIALVERLVLEAEQAAGRLESLLARVDAMPGNGHGASWQNASPAAATAPLEPPTDVAGRSFDEIYALSDAGLNHEAIAQQVGTPVGEVELVLALRERRAAGR